MDEAQIISRCKDGDIGAYKAVYDRYGQPLLRTAQRMLGSRQDAEDAVQTAFIRLFRGISRFQGRSRLSTYLFRILIHVCYDMLKTRRKMKLMPIGDTDAAVFTDPSEMMNLEAAIEALPPQMKLCFTLFAVEEMKQEDIAQVLGLSLGGVKSNIYHAKRKLRACLAEQGEKAI